MDKDKKNLVTYTLTIKYDPDTDNIEYIAEGMDDYFDFTPINLDNLTMDNTAIITSEDMETIKALYGLEDN
tara:strand:- start:5903 stop:6115 length:213 start_codon:yes stop_codon:yes gene_type:complete